MSRSKVGDYIDASLEMSWPKAGIVADSCRPRWANHRLHPRQPVALIMVMAATVGAQLNSVPTLAGSLIDSTVMVRVRRSTHATKQLRYATTSPPHAASAFVCAAMTHLKRGRCEYGVACVCGTVCVRA